MIPVTHAMTAIPACSRTPSCLTSSDRDSALPTAGPSGLSLERLHLEEEYERQLHEVPSLTPCSAQLEEVKRILRNVTPDVRCRAVAALAAECECKASDGELTRAPSPGDNGCEQPATTDPSCEQSAGHTGAIDATGDLGLCRGRNQRCPRRYRAERGCDGLCLLCEKDRPTWWTYDDERMLQDRAACGGLRDLPSLGSALHPGRCRPCGFHAKSGCSEGDKCFHCHACDRNEQKTRRKEKLTKLREEEKLLNEAQHQASLNELPAAMMPFLQPVVQPIVFWMPHGYSGSASQTHNKRKVQNKRMH